MPPLYTVEILDINRTPITKVVSFVPVDTTGNYLKFSQKLSDYGSCTFRVATKDPLLARFGDILQPNANHIRIKRGNTVVWQGIIVKNPTRERRYIEVVAYEYLYLLDRVLLRHDNADGNGAEEYRNLNNFSMAFTIAALVNEAKADGPSALSGISTGVIDNPNFPQNFTDINNHNIGGQPWNFSNNFYVKFDWRTYLYAIDQLAVYSVCDYELTKDLVFNFRTRIGSDRPDLVFSYSQYGQIENYNAMRNGEGQANFIVGIAADNNFNVLKIDQTDIASVAKYGKLAAVAAYSDVKNVDLLRSRVAQELTLVSTPDSEIQVTLNQNAYPLGQYGIGDTITLDIKDYANIVRDMRRIVQISVSVHNTGKETIQLITNKPRPT